MLAIGLLSGGLDSSLAVKVMMEQGITVVALKFTSPFCQCDSGGCCHAAELAEKLGIEFKSVPKGQEYLDIVRDPKFGRGSGMNPCIDCRIFMLKRAKQIADDMGAKFLFTGEVVGQRPMSQHRNTMALIEREAGLEGKLLRPLSAKLLPPTEAEKEGWVDREALLAISGRSRKPQIKLAEEKGLVDYPCPAGGCLLTSQEFAAKLSDFLEHNPDNLTARDVAILKVGRHFRVDGHKVVIGRDEKENARLRTLAGDGFIVLEPVSVPGPVCLCEGDDAELLSRASGMVARYSDHEGRAVAIRIGSAHGESVIEALPSGHDIIDSFRIGKEQVPVVISTQ
ncbi:hypothetical protein [Methanomassiliicoccus luminyensis]|jgi:tRNA-specific 2-thiouridylase|uniref:hypothetical protein n=1 Tax=Methanomassiliicoccus luminyensis TaxID=1080712 RepID=UPI0003738249|nr:hypothetical protein [Methanomassiliicoccus luminyensis]